MTDFEVACDALAKAGMEHAGLRVHYAEAVLAALQAACPEPCGDRLDDEPVLDDREEETARLVAAAGIAPRAESVQIWRESIAEQARLDRLNKVAFVGGALKSALERIAERYAVHHVTGDDAGLREALRSALAIVEADR